MSSFLQEPTIPTQKVGTAFQSPSWRAECLFRPAKFGLSTLQSNTDESGGYLKRLIGWSGVQQTPSNFSDDLRDILFELPTRHRQLYLEVTRDDVRGQLTLTNKSHATWNLSTARARCNDEWLLQAIEHVSGVRYNADIAFALKLGTDESQSVVAKFIGYSIFLGESDVALFKTWRIAPKRIAWFRRLFFDFSHFPKLQVAKWALLRQLTNNETFSEVDFNYFKRIGDLGDIALRAQCDFSSLTDDERLRVEEYLGNTAVVNVLDQHAAIRTIDDSRQYSRSVTEFVKLKVQKQHVRNVELTMQMNNAKLQHITNAQGDLVLPEEQLLLDDLVKRSLVNAPPLQVKTIADLK